MGSKTKIRLLIFSLMSLAAQRTQAAERSEALALHFLLPTFSFKTKSNFGIYDYGIAAKFSFSPSDAVNISFKSGVPFKTSYGSFTDISSHGETRQVQAKYVTRFLTDFISGFGIEYQYYTSSDLDRRSKN